MFIDIHAHAYRRPVPFVVQFCTPEQVLQRYDEAGIEKGALLPIVSPEIYLPQANEDILDMAAQYPDRFIPFCNVDPRALTNSADAPQLGISPLKRFKIFVRIIAIIKPKNPATSSGGKYSPKN